ncbi:hypothetical protein F2Q70_00038217 [Brassica cretica]|uniref:Uncharacterized protein n=1 Tax=Brassica cretica TaxID=69181 RepID=A0A8S9KD05_BRACR|nr:hypothetical protein F2Q70_00038217 [Brassica cretica]
MTSSRPVSSFDDQVKSCPEAKGGSVRVQISPSRPVSVYMVKPRLCQSRDQFSPVQIPLLGSWIMEGGRV